MTLDELLAHPDMDAFLDLEVELVRCAPWGVPVTLMLVVDEEVSAFWALAEGLVPVAAPRA